jgi:hypothetical protein
MKQFNLLAMAILLLSGCQMMPKEPKKPDSSPRVPINKTIPPEIQQAECRPHAECQTQESLYENPAR